VQTENTYYWLHMASLLTHNCYWNRSANQSKISDHCTNTCTCSCKTWLYSITLSGL